jgi:UTP:GlnB (protein PII) uridylyltransferase
MQKQVYIRAMLQEMEQRHRAYAQSKLTAINLKEKPGGLRDIEMMLDIFRALFEFTEQSNYRLFNLLKSILPEYENRFQDLYKNYEFLRVVRNLNRLAIAADDSLNLQYFYNLTENLPAPADQLTPEDLLMTIEQVNDAVTKIIAELVQKIVMPFQE